MVSEIEVIKALHNIFLVLGVMSIQCLDELRLDETLFVQPLLVFQNFQGNELLLLVVENAEDDAKGALAQFLNDLIAEA